MGRGIRSHWNKYTVGKCKGTYKRLSYIIIYIYLDTLVGKKYMYAVAMESNNGSATIYWQCIRGWSFEPAAIVCQHWFI